MPARRRPPITVFIPSLVLLLAGAGMVVGALSTVVVIHATTSVVVAIVAALVGVPAIGTCTSATVSPGWPAMGLLPMVGVVALLEAWVFEAGRAPVISGLIVPAAAWTCLYLPSTRAFVAP
jgi:hypothetical protein